MLIVEARVIRRKTPIPLDAGMAREKEEMLAKLRGVREQTLAFIEETRGRDLSKCNMPHTYEWLQFIASHQIRHMKQMREITATLPKTVASLQK